MWVKREIMLFVFAVIDERQKNGGQKNQRTILLPPFFCLLISIHSH